MSSAVTQFLIELVSATAVAGPKRCPAWLRRTLRVGFVVLLVAGLAAMVIWTVA